MLNPRKKITKKELKEDPLVTRYFLAVDYLDKHKKEIAYYVLGAAAAIAIIFLFISSGKKAELQAVSRVGQVEILYMRGQFQEAADEFRNIATQYADTDAAGMATYYLANCYYYLNQYEEAERYYRQYIDDYGNDPEITSSCYAGIGATFENRQNFQEAIAEYRKAVGASKDGFAVPQYMLNIARCQAAMDDRQAARNTYREVISEYPDSPFMEKAEELMAQL